MDTTSTKSAEQRHLTLERISWKLSGDAFLLPVSGFPIPSDELKSVREFLAKLGSTVVGTSRLSVEVFLQVAQLHIADGISRLTSHGRKWMPKIGLGVWPDREPPTIWKADEFMDLGPDERPRRLLYQVFRVGASLESRDNAREMMLGLGTVIQIITADDTQALLLKGRSRLLPLIIDPSFRSFPYYIPLLDRKGLLSANSPEELEGWLCGAEVYLRESTEDSGILILARDSLGPIISSLGGEVNSSSKWRIKV